jgi:hypothetical protein
MVTKLENESVSIGEFRQAILEMKISNSSQLILLEERFEKDKLDAQRFAELQADEIKRLQELEDREKTPEHVMPREELPDPLLSPFVSIMRLLDRFVPGNEEETSCLDTEFDGPNLFPFD